MMYFKIFTKVFYKFFLSSGKIYLPSINQFGMVCPFRISRTKLTFKFFFSFFFFLFQWTDRGCNGHPGQRAARRVILEEQGPAAARVHPRSMVGSRV